MDRRHHSLLPHYVGGRSLVTGMAVVGLCLSACGGSEDLAAPAETINTTEVTAAPEPTTGSTAVANPPAADDPATFFPDVLDATAIQADDGTWTFNVTLSSRYDTPEQYADAWRVVDADGNELGIRVLGHDHATEQPFTRSQSGIVIPEGTSSVTIQGRDQANGWGGDFLEFEVPS